MEQGACVYGREGGDSADVEWRDVVNNRSCAGWTGDRDRPVETGSCTRTIHLAAEYIASASVHAPQVPRTLHFEPSFRVNILHSSAFFYHSGPNRRPRAAFTRCARQLPARRPNAASRSTCSPSRELHESVVQGRRKRPTCRQRRMCRLDAPATRARRLRSTEPPHLPSSVRRLPELRPGRERSSGAHATARPE